MTLRLQLIFGFLLLFCIAQSMGQSITLSFPGGVQTCNDEISFNIVVLNDTGDTIPDGVITLDPSATAGLEYLSIASQTSGPLLTETIAGMSTFEFDDTLFNGQTLEFELTLSLDCQGANLASTGVSVDFDYNTTTASSSTSQDLNGFGVDSPDIDVNNSMPTTINGVVGYEFSIVNTLENNGTADADSVFYCVEDNANAQLLNIEIGGTVRSPSANTIPGFTCFKGAMVIGASVVVTENWVITSCNAPVQDLFRKATFGCQGDLDCSMEPDSQFPSTTLNLVAPVDPITITTTNIPQLSVCGDPEVLCITIDNNNGSGFTTENVALELTFPADLIVDYSTLMTKTGNPVSMIPGTDSISIGDLADVDTSSFSIELSVPCGTTASSVDYTIDLKYDELCEGAANTVQEMSPSITVATPDIDINTSTPIGIDGVIGYEFSIDNTVENNGTVDADSVYYCVEENTSADLLSIVVGGMTLSPSANTIPGFTCFKGAMVIGASVVVTENWVITSCNAPVQDLFRKATFGCQGDLDCSMEPDSQFPSTTLNLVAPVDPITITTTNIPQLSVCGDPEVLCITIDNNNGSGFSTENVALELTFPADLIVDYSTLMTKTGNPVSMIPGTDSISIGDLADVDTSSFSIELSVPCGTTASSVDYTIDLKYDELCEGAANTVQEMSPSITVATPDIDINTSTPIGIDGVIGYEFSIDNTVENNGTVDADSVYYCVEENTSADLLSIVVGGMTLSPSANMIPGFTCFEITI